MKNLIVLVSLCVFAFAANAQTADSEKSMKLKKHVCTAACTTDGHVLVHGEEGHTCGKECAAMMGKGHDHGKHTGQELTAHICSDKCSTDAHHYLHGEKGHTCGKDCEGMMKKDHKHDGHGHGDGHGY